MTSAWSHSNNDANHFTPWDVSDKKFVFGPRSDTKIPSSNVWAAISDRLLEKDAIQCEAWKEEVKNQLIFAGLFSAVVTAFIMESYKLARPDPQDDIVRLLSIIAAASVEDPKNRTMDAIPAHTFTPTPSSKRVNALWFLSLVLSLSTVLIGTVALQWLREYRSYAGQNGAKTAALFHMRSEGLKKWHVGTVFTALTLLTQAALILFFSGLIDFLLSIGCREIMIPATVAIGLTLFFLLVTTILPTFQGLSLYTPFLFSQDLQKEPNQCPYKSPQSHVFRQLFSFTFGLASWFFPMSRSFVRKYRQVIFSKVNRLDMESVEIPPVVPQILATWTKPTWIDFDLAWLTLRDVSAHSRYENLMKTEDDTIFKSDLDRNNGYAGDVQLYDLTRALRQSMSDNSAIFTEPFRSTVIMCFAELSENLRYDSSWVDVPIAITDTEKARFDTVIQRNWYFHFLMFEANDDYDDDIVPSDTMFPFYPTAPSQNFARPDDGLNLSLATGNPWEFGNNANIMHHENLYRFLTKFTQPETKAEVMVRLARGLYGMPPFIQPKMRPDKQPEYLSLDFGKLLGNEQYCPAIIFQRICILHDFFRSASLDRDISLVLTNSIYYSQCVPTLLESIGKFLPAVWKPSTAATISLQDRDRIAAASNSVLSCIKDGLLDAIPVFADSAFTIYLLYVSAIYIRVVHRMSLELSTTESCRQPPLIDLETLRDIVSLIRRVKKLTIDAGRREVDIEEAFKGHEKTFTPWLPTPPRFSDAWWSEFLDDHQSSSCEQWPAPQDEDAVVTKPGGSTSRSIGGDVQPEDAGVNNLPEPSKLLSGNSMLLSSGHHLC